MFLPSAWPKFKLHLCRHRDCQITWYFCSGPKQKPCAFNKGSVWYILYTSIQTGKDNSICTTHPNSKEGTWELTYLHSLQSIWLNTLEKILNNAPTQPSQHCASVYLWREIHDDCAAGFWKWNLLLHCYMLLMSGGQYQCSLYPMFCCFLSDVYNFPPNILLFPGQAGAGWLLCNYFY